MYHFWKAPYDVTSCNDVIISHQAVQQEVASKQPEFDSLAVCAPHLQAAQARMEATSNQLNDRYTALKTQAKVV